MRVEDEIDFGYGKKSHTSTVVAIPSVSASGPKSKKRKTSQCLETVGISESQRDERVCKLPTMSLTTTSLTSKM